MIKDYFMAIKAKHTIKRNRILYTKQQKKIMLNLLTTIVSIYNDKGVTSGDINLDIPIDKRSFSYYTDAVLTPVYRKDNFFTRIKGNPRIPGMTYRSIIKWGIMFYLKISADGKHVEYYIEAI